ncbi:DNA-binding MarR family transcriptional regulator [Solirubrobacter pauli]|uniref:DNA-binding MarR family transcriptional regulator n=1 Tax=Solirubrobacter pauli TaxID=166793 RepID=A0A660LDF6_9ACTN|nr:MarR family transcriptional regulator [Solirubrobacter pauli]RKQ90751.1 DNA-binding MarR family transcriptional regulator [Solirubrobacter pauli]
MKDTPKRLQHLPSWQLSQAALNGDRLVNEALGTEGVRKYHFRVLVALEDDGPLSQAELGRRLAIDRSDMAAVAAELEQRGYLARTRDEQDRRRNVVTITPAGGEALARMDEAIDGAQRALLAPLSEAERQQLTRLLARLL